MDISKNAPLSSPDSERIVLSHIMGNEYGYKELAEYLEPNPFYKPLHFDIYEAIKEQVKDGKTTDLIAIIQKCEKLYSKKNPDTNYYAEITGIAISATNIDAEYHAAALQEFYQKRRATEIAIKIADLSTDKTADLTEIASLVAEAKALVETPNCKYKAALADDTDALFESYKERPKAIQTNFVLGKGKEQYRLALPSGAISVVAAPTNHGKSKILQSITLDIIGELQRVGDSGSVLYLTYEENKASVVKQFINSYMDVEITKESLLHGNLETISEYLATGSTKYIKAEAIDKVRREIPQFKQLLKSGRLIVVKPENNYLETLLGLLRYAIKTHNIKAVVLDYVQELYIDSYKNGGRTDELKEIMIQIDLIAQSADIPFLMAAQLKQETDSPLSLDNQSIADSKWIGYKASEIVLFWSNKEKCKNDPKEEKASKVKQNIPSLNLGEKGKLYAVLTKSRLAPRTGLDAILTIHGNTGKVQPNYTEPTPEQTDLPFEARTAEEDAF